MSTRLVILGATGDLTSRYLMPALAGLRECGSLPAVRVVGVGREPWDTPAFRQHIAERLEAHAGHLSATARADIVGTLDYRQADVADPGQLAAVLAGGSDPVAVYLALPPGVFGDVLRGLARLKLPRGSQILIEKPFGHDLASARELNQLIRPAFPERSVFRIDHFLGKQTVQNLLGLRFANRVFESVWNRDHVERVEITWDETVALEGRAGYYDRAGALKDMVQNHLLQLLCLTTMEAPASFDERDFRDRKVDVLRAVRRLDADEVVRHTARARYTAGRVGDRSVPDYTAEPGVNPERMTETFTRVTLFVDNRRWAGVPFVLRTGKALVADRHEIAIHFRPVAHSLFSKGPKEPNLLRLSLNPDRMELGVNINGPGDPFELERVEMETRLAPQPLPAYARLLLDLFEGDAVLSIRGDEAEASWRVVEPIIEGWAAGRVPLREYAAGSAGP